MSHDLPLLELSVGADAAGRLTTRRLPRVEDRQKSRRTEMSHSRGWPTCAPTKPLPALNLAI